MIVRHPRRGANAIEFALTAPVFFGLVLGLVDYSWIFATKSGLDNAASLACREGAMRDPMFGSPVTEAKGELVSRSAYWCGLSDGCTHVVTPLLKVPDRTLHCSVTLTVRPLVGLVPLPPALRSDAYYRLEWQRPGAM